jgi:hypothetical protein
MRPPVEFTTVDENHVDVSTRDAWLGSLKPSTYGVWVFVDGDYVEYNSDQLRQIAVKLEEMNSDDDG